MAIIDDVRSIIAKSLNIPVEQLAPDKRLDELGAESLDVIEIVFALEEKYDIAIPLQANDATRVSASGKTDGKTDGKTEDKSEGQDKSGDSELPFATVGDVAEMVEKLVAAKAPK